MRFFAQFHEFPKERQVYTFSIYIGYHPFRNNLPGFPYYKSFSLLIIASFLGSLSGIIDKISLSNNYAKSGGFLFWFMFFLCILSGIAYLKKNKRIDFKVLKTNYWIIVLGTSLAFSDMLYYSAVSIADSSISWISIIRKLSVFVSVVLASIFLKENKLFIKLIIMLFMFAGILLILLL